MTPTPAGAAAERVGIVVVTYSPGPALEQLLASVPAAAGRPIDLVLADNGSTDGTVEAAATRPWVRLVRTGGNVGYGRAANVGVAALAADVESMLVVNPDVVLEPGAIDELVDALRRHPGAGAAGPLILTAEGLVYPSARQLPSIGRGIGHAVFGWWWPTNPWTREYRRDAEPPRERTAGWLSGSCVLLRRAAFDQVGGFDPGYFMYFEDVDLGERLGHAGWTSVYCPQARVTHTGGHATARQPAEMITAHHRSAYRYLARRYPAWWQAPLRIALRGGLAVRAVLSRRSAAVAHGAAIPPRRAG